MPAEQPELERSAARATLRGGDADAASPPDLSVSREADAELQRQREWFRVTLASIGDAVITTDSEARVTFLNPVAEALTGWSSAAAIGQPVQAVFRVIDDLTRESFDNIVTRVLREQRVLGLANHSVLIAKNGREIPIEDSAAPILDAAGHVLGVVLVFHDVAEKRKVQDALRASEERYRTVAEFTYDWEYWRTAEERFLYMSASCERITGYRQDEFLEDAGLYLRIIHPDDRERVAVHLRDDLPHRDLRELEFRIVRRDGQVRWIGHACQLVVGTSGQPMGRRACNRDITARKELEAALREAKEQLEARVRERTTELRQSMELVGVQRQQFRNALDLLPAYLVLLTPDHRVLFANRFFEERFGKSDGRRCYEYLFGRTEPCERCESFQAFHTNAPHRWEWTGPDGRLYDIYDFPFVDVDGARMIMEVGLDITERRQAEAELVEHRAHLEELVRERTRQLAETNARLEAEIIARTQAAEELRAGNEELQRFNRAMVGRELRMIELKHEVNELCARAGQPPRYPEDFDKYPR